MLSASVFTDPAYRDGLEAFYNKKKSDLIASLKEREAAPGFSGTLEAKIRTPDGEIKTVTGHLITSDMAEKSLVSFDKWLEFQSDSFDMMGGSRDLKRARDQVARMEELNPESPSHVLNTFSANGMLLAYINEDGSVVTSNGAEAMLGDVLAKADAMGLGGYRRISYLQQEIPKVLAETYPNLNMMAYEPGQTPTKRAFATLWYPQHDVDKAYTDAVSDAKAHLAAVEAWHKQWQANMNEIQSYLLQFQEV